MLICSWSRPASIAVAMLVGAVPLARALTFLSSAEVQSDNLVLIVTGCFALVVGCLEAFCREDPAEDRRELPPD